MTVLVLGGSGRTGRKVVDGLRARGVDARPASRSGPVTFDWHEPATWRAALTGATAIYVVTPEDPAFPAERIGEFTVLAERAGVRRLVLLSGRSARFGSPVLAPREEALRESAVDWTILRPGYFHQNFSEGGFLGPMLAGALRMPVEDGWPRVDFIDVGDIAEVAVTTLTQDGHAGEVYELSGPRALTFPDAVAEVAKAAGRTITCTGVPLDQWAREKAEAGASEEAVRWSVRNIRGVLRGDYATVFPDTARILGRAPRDFADYAAEAAATGVWAPAQSSPSSAAAG